MLNICWSLSLVKILSFQYETPCRNHGWIGEIPHWDYLGCVQCRNGIPWFNGSLTIPPRNETSTFVLPFCNTNDSNNPCWVQGNPQKTHHKSHNCKENIIFEVRNWRAHIKTGQSPVLVYFLFVDQNNVTMYQHIPGWKQILYYLIGACRYHHGPVSWVFAAIPCLGEGLSGQFTTMNPSKFAGWTVWKSAVQRYICFYSNIFKHLNRMCLNYVCLPVFDTLIFDLFCFTISDNRSSIHRKKIIYEFTSPVQALQIRHGSSWSMDMVVSCNRGTS